MTRHITDPAEFRERVGGALLGWIAATVGGRWASPQGALVYCETSNGPEQLVRDFVAWGRDADSTARMQEFGYELLKAYGLGCELKPSYWRTAVDNLTALEAELSHPSLFDTA